MDVRNRWRGARALAGAFAVLALAACASAGGGGGESGGVMVRVENNLIPPTSLSVYAVPDVGSRRLVGVVTPGATTTLRFNPGAPAAQYRFVAETTEGREIASNPVSFSSGATIRWDLRANIATVTAPG